MDATSFAETGTATSGRQLAVGDRSLAGLLRYAAGAIGHASEWHTTAIVWGSAALAPTLTSVAGLLLARRLIPADYGEVAYFLSVVGLVVLLGSLGLTTQMTTVVARHSAVGSLDGAVPRVISLAAARLASIALICAAAMFAGTAGNPVVRSAGLTAGVVLATGFAHGVIRGAGRVRLAAGLPVAQAAVYLVAVTLWAGSTPERVFAAMAASYGMSLLVSLPICRPLFEACLRIGLRARAPIRRVVSSSSPVYLLSLLLAPFASIAVIGLGAAGRFGDAALFSAALTLALALSTALSLVVSVQYFPRACVLASSGEGGAAWFDRFYRPFASLGVAVAAMQVVFPGDAIVALFTNRYVGGADVLRSLAGVGAFLALGQLAVWTLFAHGRVRFALFGTGTQLTVLLAWVVLVIHLPALPLWVLGDGHVVAAASGLAVCALGINRLDRSYRLHARRLAAALLTVIAAEIGLRDLMLAVYAGRYLPIGALVVATLIGTLIAATVLMSELLARLWRQAGEDQR